MHSLPELLAALIKGIVPFGVLLMHVGPCAAQVALTPKSGGSIGRAELDVLLPQDLFFEVFDLDADIDHCIEFSYLYRLGTEEAQRGSGSHICNRAGMHRITVALRPASDAWAIDVGLHDTETGAGGSFRYGGLDLGGDILGASASKSFGTVMELQEVTRLVTWTFRNAAQGSDSVQRALAVSAKLVENPNGTIGASAR